MTYNDLLQTTHDIIKYPLQKNDIKELQRIGSMTRYSLITLDMSSFDKYESRISITRLEKKWDMVSYARHLSIIPMPNTFIRMLAKNLTGDDKHILCAKEDFMYVPPDFRTVITTPRCGTFAQSNSRLLYQLSISPLSLPSSGEKKIVFKRYVDSMIFIGSQLIDAKNGQYM